MLIEPGAGMAPIYALLRSAHHSVDLVMYELEDTQAEQLLAGDAARGVDVRVLLNSAYTGSVNDGAFGYLQRHGVHVHGRARSMRSPTRKPSWWTGRSPWS